ncbi:MAG: transcriptional regulator [Nanohaloarchaea archaeon QH_8_44_6]|nr:MAG: transcriptional regulator [Nanohaloarchaea archaeon SW_7_46_7]PSH02422.1 MAG: transcriptional regulator [Nanohaloarchaea archaeon QH_8_44_6]
MTDQGPRERVIQAFEQSAGLYGFNESYARLYGILYFEGEKTMDELVEYTGFSKSTVSRGMNKLEDIYMVESRKKEGEGKTRFYSAEEDLESAFMRIMENEGEREIEIMREALEKAEEEMEEEGDEEGLEKVRNLKKFYLRSEKFLNLLKKMPRGKTLDRLSRAVDRVIPGD